MVTIKILLFGRTSFHCASHVAAIITDSTTNHTFKIHYPFDTHGRFIDHPDKSLYALAKNNCCISVTHLYSDKSFADFMTVFDEHDVSAREFSWRKNNCANQVNFVLDYFFPDQSCVNALSTLYQSLCGICCILTLGCSWCPALPCCVTTPRDVSNKAWLLSFKYGQAFEEQSFTKEENIFPLSGRITYVEQEGDDPVERLTKGWHLV